MARRFEALGLITSLAFAVAFASPATARADACALDEATTRARDAALRDGDASSLAAAKGYLERLNALGMKNDACFAAMASDAARLRAMHCRRDSPAKESDACVLLDEVALDAERLQAQRVVEEADEKKSADDAQPLYEKGAGLYLAAYREHCEAPAQEMRPLHVSSTSTCDELAYASARAFRSGHMLGKAIAVYRAMVRSAERTTGSSNRLADATYELGAAYQSLSLFDHAADWYERYATLHPRAPNAVAAMRDSAILRLGLGQPEVAMRDAMLLVKNWGYTRRPEAAELLLSIATHHADRGEHAKARGLLTGAMDLLDRGPPDLEVRAHALLARTAPQLASREYAKVLARWSDPAAAERAIVAGWPSDDRAKIDRRLARALIVVGEATFAAAEDRRIADVEPLKPPVYAGPADRASVVAHVQTAMRDFSTRKRSAIERVEGEYAKVLQIRPFPPPEWVVRSSASVGRMWGDLADDFRRAPLPNVLRSDPALEKAYAGAIASLSEALRDGRAKPAMKKCVDLASKYRVAEVESRSCASWLASRYPGEHHAVGELLPELLSGTRAAEVSPLLYDGQHLHRQ